MRNYLILLFLALIPGYLQAQMRTISGYVRDQANGESLIGATAFDKKLGKGTITNNFGFYSITTPNDSVNITFSFVGYDAATIKLKIARDTTMVVFLKSGKVLEEVIVSGTRAEPLNESTRMGSVTVPTAQIKAIPAFMGEVDVLKAMQLLPGVSGGAEGSSNLIIRGGNPEQTLILMDGATIYNPTHLYGIFSAFNPDAVNNIELVKGGFPARYGGRLSGIADITLKEGNMNKFGGEGSLGLIASRFMIEGPITKGKTSFIVSGRRGYMGLMKSQIQKRLGGASLTDGYYFYDLNAKINHRINGKNRIYASIYSGKDYASASSHYYSDDPIDGFNHIRDIKTKDVITWANTVGSIRWNHEISNRLFFNVSGVFSKYDLKITNDFHYHQEQYPGPPKIVDYLMGYNYTTAIRDLGVKIDFDYIPNTNHYIRFGGAIIQHRFVPGVGSRSSNDPNFVVTPNSYESNPKEANIYAEDDFSITRSTKINYGVHAVAYRANTKTYYGAQPRFSIRQAITPDLSVKASYSYMQQYVHMLTNAGLGMPTDLWVPVTDNIKPQSSNQVALGVARLVKKKIEVSVEAYYKTMENIVEYKDGTTYMNSTESWESKVEQGHGKAYGVEFFVQKKTGRFNGWAGYTLSWNKRQFDNINNGEWFYYRYDHRHDLKITGSYTLNKHFDVSSTFIYTTGNAVTMALDQMPTNYVFGRGSNRYFSFTPAYESRNNLRMPSYHRLDISGSYSFRARNLDHKVTLAIYNIYDRHNPFYINVEYDYKGLPHVVTRALFPILPSISYAIKF